MLKDFTQGIAAHAEGGGTLATGDWSHAEGYFNKAYGIFSHCEGAGNLATGNGAHAEGNICVATGYWSHAEGQSCDATGDWSHAEGSSTSASNSITHAEGFATLASGPYSHAEGYSTIASGDSSHAEGYLTIASGDSSHAAGVNSLASLRGQNSQSSGGFTSGIGGTGNSTAQTTVATMIGLTDNVTPTLNLTLDGLTPVAGNRFIIQFGKAYLFFVEIIAKGTFDRIASFIRYFIINDLNPGVVLIGTVETIGTDKGTNAGIPPVGWTVTITADAPNQAIKIAVTNSSVSSTDITRWVARVQATEVKMALA
jgi:hypothetical protein